jgi:hypothetical protein
MKMEDRKICLQDLFQAWSISENTLQNVAERLGGATVPDLMALKRYCLLDSEKEEGNIMKRTWLPT